MKERNHESGKNRESPAEGRGQGARQPAPPVTCKASAAARGAATPWETVLVTLGPCSGQWDKHICPDCQLYYWATQEGGKEIFNQ